MVDIFRQRSTLPKCQVDQHIHKCYSVLTRLARGLSPPLVRVYSYRLPERGKVKLVYFL